MRVLVWALLLLIGTNAKAIERSFYLPDSKVQDGTELNEVFVDLEPDRLADFVEAYGRWSKNIMDFEEALAHQPLPSQGHKLDTEIRKKLLEWTLGRSRDVLRLALQYRWIASSNEQVARQLEVARIPSGVSRQELQAWAMGATLVLLQVRATMEQDAFEYPLLVRMAGNLAGTLDGANELWVRQRWLKRLHQMSDRSLAIRDHMRGRIREIRRVIKNGN